MSPRLDRARGSEMGYRGTLSLKGFSCISVEVLSTNLLLIYDSVELNE